MPDCINTCWQCDRRFSTAARFHQHYTVAHSSNAQVCSVCNKKFPTKAVLDGHTNAHLRNAHSCNICGEFCSTWVDLYVHVTVRHKYAENVVCDICKSTFSLKHHLKKHVLREHCSKIVAIEETAELSCTIHSSVSFPNEDVLLDSLIRGDVLKKRLETEKDKNSKYGKLAGESTHSESPKLSGPVLKTSNVRRTATLAVSKKVKVPFHLNENELVDISQPNTLMHFPSRQLDSQQPRQNTPCPTNLLTIRTKSNADERNLLTQQQLFQKYSCLLSAENTQPNRKPYHCDLCGMGFEDWNSFLEVHVTAPGSFFGIA